MKITCPHCGKELDISAEELTIHGGTAVCPKCLHVWQAAAVDTNLKVHRSAPRSASSKGVSDDWGTFAFCYRCGKPLPENVQFCPYCGADLTQPFRGRSPHAATRDENDTATTTPPRRDHAKPPTPRRAAAATTTTEKKVSDQAPSNASTLRYPPYRFDTRPLMPRVKKASLGFRIFAFIIIAALIALFFYIVYKGFSL